MLCSVVKHAGSSRARKCRGKHEKQSSVFPYFLSALPLPKCFTTEQSTVENLFISLRVLLKSNKTCCFRTVFTLLSVVNNGLREPYLLLTNSSFILLLSESCTGNVVKIRKQKCESQFNVINPCFVL